MDASSELVFSNFLLERYELERSQNDEVPASSSKFFKFNPQMDSTEKDHDPIMQEFCRLPHSPPDR